MTSQEYNTIHKWVQYNYKKTGVCTKCKVNNLSGKKIHWANISGNYLRIRSDWIELCAKCHKKFDNRYYTGNPIFSECANCNKLFRTYPCLLGDKIYYSRKCYTIMRTGKVKNFSLTMEAI